MNEQQIIGKTVDFVRDELIHAEGGHDWWHIERVWNNARTIAQSEPADLFIVELGALLHDIADHKFTGGDESVGVGKARSFLESLGTGEWVTAHVVNIMTHISFKGGNFSQEFSSPELAVVQDADRLDAIGAIGIARAFNYGGFRGREMYNPAVKPASGMTPGQYHNSTAPTINHFYEKLLLLKDRMNTATGRRMAEERHRFMELYLEHFYREWDGG
ncbi:MAG: HD domain-containing protein [Bacteroidota bacterium]